MAATVRFDVRLILSPPEKGPGPTGPGLSVGVSGEEEAVGMLRSERMLGKSDGLRELPAVPTGSAATVLMETKRAAEATKIPRILID